MWHLDASRITGRYAVVISTILGLLIMLATPTSLWAITPLSTDEMRAETGQTLLNVKYTAPSGSAGSSNDFGFYHVGLSADIAINQNIQSLKLGCSGANYTNCDIDIDNMSLSGAGTTREARAASDAIIKNPFIEFAIRNPNSASTREISGMRFSSEGLIGQMTSGLENSDVANGINRLSGYLKVQSDSSGLIKGNAVTAAKFTDAAVYPLYGTMTVLSGLMGSVKFKQDGGGYWIPAMQVPFSTAGIVINGSRIAGMSLTTTTAIPPLYLGWDVDPNNCQFLAFGTCNHYGNVGTNFPVQGVFDSVNNEVRTQGGPMHATVQSCVWIACLTDPTGTQMSGIKAFGKISGLTTTTTFNEALGFTHTMNVNSPFSLSLQKEAVHWPGADTADIAQKGWWMSFKDPVNLGELNPAAPLDVCADAADPNRCILPQITTQMQAYLDTHPANTDDLAGILAGNPLSSDLGSAVLSKTLSLTSSNMKLAGQDFVPNCYGVRAFC